MKRLLAALVTAAVAVEARSDGMENAREAAKFQATKWTIVRSLKDVDADVLLSLKARLGRDDRIADRGEPFEVSDVLTKIPPRRLVLAGRSGRRWFVAYQVGGRAAHLVLTVWEAAMPPRPLLLAHGQAGAHEDALEDVELDDLRDALKTRRLFLEDPTAPYY